MKMQRIEVLKKLSMRCGLCVAAVPLVGPAPLTKESGPLTGDDAKRNTLVRPSQLPIYVSDEICAGSNARAAECPPSMLEEGFGTVRKGVQALLSEYSSVTENFSNKVSTGYEHSLLMLDYLREESNIMPRLGAVGMGGLTGLVFSLRGGKFKRLVYTSTGALSVAAVCYPKNAQDTFTLAKHYVNIGYNFVYGVKPGDANQLEIKWPEMPKIKLPSSASEFFDLAVDTGSGLASSVASLASTVIGGETTHADIKTTDAVPKAKND